MIIGLLSAVVVGVIIGILLHRSIHNSEIEKLKVELGDQEQIIYALQHYIDDFVQEKAKTVSPTQSKSRTKSKKAPVKRKRSE